MSTKAQALARTLATLFPQLTIEARRQLAEELEGLIDKSTEQGWDLANVTLHAKGARRNQIGTTLQSLRTRAGLTQEEVTRMTAQLTRREPWHVAKVTRIESGRVPVSFVDLQFLLRLYGVTDRATVETLWVLAQESHSPRRAARKAS